LIINARYVRLTKPLKFIKKSLNNSMIALLSRKMRWKTSLMIKIASLSRKYACLIVPDLRKSLSMMDCSMADFPLEFKTINSLKNIVGELWAIFRTTESVVGLYSRLLLLKLWGKFYISNSLTKTIVRLLPTNLRRMP